MKTPKEQLPEKFDPCKIEHRRPTLHAAFEDGLRETSFGWRRSEAGSAGYVPSEPTI